MKKFLPFIIICALLLPLGLSASPIDALKPVGSAKLSVVFWDIYQSTLYSDDGTFTSDDLTHESQSPLALNIQYLRDIETEELVEATADEWNKLGLGKTTYQPWLKQLTAIWPDIQENDELLFVLNHTDGGVFYFNQREIGRIDDRNFGVNFLRIWLDKKASYPKLRNKLVGQSK